MTNNENVNVWRVDGHFGGTTRWILETSEEMTAWIQSEADRRDVYASRLMKDLIELIVLDVCS